MCAGQGLAQPPAGTVQTTHDGADGDVERFRRFGVTELLDVDQLDDDTKGRRQLVQRPAEILVDLRRDDYLLGTEVVSVVVFRLDDSILRKQEFAVPLVAVDR